MSIFKNTLLFSGWVPTLLGGSFGVWWMNSDKTIRDVLSRTGFSFLEKKEDFENLYYELEGDEEFYKDIPDAKDLKGKAISQWCSENLDLPLTEENIKDKLPKAEKYCLGDKKISSGIKKFKNFKEIFGLLNKFNLNKDTPITIANLSDDPNQDSYYIFYNDGNLDEQEWKQTKTSRKNILWRKLYINESDKSKILPTNSEDSQIKWNWHNRAIHYDNKNTLIPKIPSLKFAYTNSRGEKIDWRDMNRLPEQGMLSNMLKKKCDEYLKEKYYSEEDYNQAYKDFSNWCFKDDKFNNIQ